MEPWLVALRGAAEVSSAGPSLFDAAGEDAGKGDRCSEPGMLARRFCLLLGRGTVALVSDTVRRLPNAAPELYELPGSV